MCGSGEAQGNSSQTPGSRPIPGMMIHQDGSRHEWVPGQMWDLIVTMDDANSEQYAMFFVAEEGTQSSFQGIREVIEKKGLSCSFYSDRGSHYWFTPEAGGKVDKKSPTQFGRAMKHLGIEMIAAYSPEARGRSERFFRTHQDRLIKELALYGITTMEEANRYIRDSYLPAFNVEFMVEPTEPRSALVEWGGPDLDDILCEQHERTVGNDNCVWFEEQNSRFRRTSTGAITSRPKSASTGTTTARSASSTGRGNWLCTTRPAIGSGTRSGRLRDSAANPGKGEARQKPGLPSIPKSGQPISYKTGQVYLSRHKNIPHEGFKGNYKPRHRSHAS